MHEGEFLQHAAVLFGTAIAVGWLFRRLHAPSIIGYLFTGLVIGPSTLGLIEEEQVAGFAETGLVLLLFVIGLELSPRPLMRAGTRILLATGIQLSVTAFLAATLVHFFSEMTYVSATIVGVAVSLSSTAIVLKALSDRGEVRSAIGNLSTGILLLQDVTVIMVMLGLPFFAPSSDGEGLAGTLVRAGLGLGGLIALAVAARLSLPSILRQITRYGGIELVTLFAVFMAAGGAFAAGFAGWPPALGACVAGLLLADSDLRHQLVSDITPFRDVFNALFFISLGMLVDLAFVVEHVGFLLLAIAVTLVAKTVITALAVSFAGWPWRVSLQAGLGLCTVSEFGYVLEREASRFDILPPEVLDAAIPYAVGTMLFGAVLVPLAGPLTRWIALQVGAKDDGEVPGQDHPEHLRNHVVIVGYGLNGENLVRVLGEVHIPFCVVEMNRGLCERAREAGAPVIVGDATRKHILHEAGIDDARAMVIAINDKQATRRIVAQARTLRPDLYILARCEDMTELDPLFTAGATVVIPSDFEVSIEIFAHVLREFRIPDNLLQAQIACVRAGGYGMLRGTARHTPAELQELLEVFRTTATQTYYLAPESCAVGESIASLNLRRETGVSIIAVVRKGEPNTNPSPEIELEAGDVLVLVGNHEQLDRAQAMLSGTAEPASVES